MFTSFKPTQLLACICLSTMFLWLGITEKLFGWSASLAFMQSRHFPMAGLLLAGALCIELIGPVLLFFRRTSGIAALTLALYCLLTALLFHNFWAGDDATHSQLQNFLKNLALCGAFLYVFSDVQRQAHASVRARSARHRWPDTTIATSMDR
jgi:putative oxidoreductase